MLYIFYISSNIFLNVNKSKSNLRYIEIFETFRNVSILYTQWYIGIQTLYLYYMCVCIRFVCSYMCVSEC